MCVRCHEPAFGHGVLGLVVLSAAATAGAMVLICPGDDTGCFIVVIMIGLLLTLMGAGAFSLCCRRRTPSTREMATVGGWTMVGSDNENGGGSQFELGNQGELLENIEELLESPASDEDTRQEAAAGEPGSQWVASQAAAEDDGSTLSSLFYPRPPSGPDNGRAARGGGEWNAAAAAAAAEE